LQAWQAAGGEVRSGTEPGHFQSNFALGAPLRTLATTRDVQGRLGAAGQTLVDARAHPRFKGDVEPLDPVAGHIPGAVNLPIADLLRADGTYRQVEDLAAALATAGVTAAAAAGAPVVASCGSGVTACQLVLAGELAGIPVALYPGSYSQWCALGRPVATGA